MTLLVLGALGIVTVVASFAFSLVVLVVSRQPQIVTPRAAAPAPDTQPANPSGTSDASDDTSDPMARVLRDIERLATLREQGALTEKEFSAQKAKLLVTPATPARARRPQRTS